jgi:hypothetical protein
MCLHLVPKDETQVLLAAAWTGGGHHRRIKLLESESACVVDILVDTRCSVERGSSSLTHLWHDF